MAQRNGNGPTAQWPPRSPQEALAGTPGGRERLRRMADRTSPSPSPLRNARSFPAPARRGGQHDDDGDAMDLDDDLNEDDDEETLQLKLQAIQAKLRLKALQRKQNRTTGGGSFEAEQPAAASRPAPAPAPAHDILAASRAQSRAAMLRDGPRGRPSSQGRPASQGEVQVPVSPVRRTQTADSQGSPTRVLLGIDKGLRAKDVSLKRANSTKSLHERDPQAAGGYLRRTHTPALSQDRPLASHTRPKSFSERLADARIEETNRKERQDRISRVRSKTFQVNQNEVERYKSEAVELPDAPAEPESFSREEVLSGGRIQRSNTAPSIFRRGSAQDIRRGSAQDVEVSSTASSSFQRNPGSASFPAPSSSRRTEETTPSEVSEDQATSFEPYSSTHLSKRILPHSLLTRTFASKKTYLIKDLLASVKAPDFELPEIERDIVVLGIVASKSEPKTHKQPENANLREKKSRFDDDDHRGKYMVISLVDLTWQVDLFLFESAFTRYWKLVPGTLVAILNPSIMPPPKGREATGRFSLVLNSDGDTVLEIGVARDLGFCKSMKKDGNLCNSWVNRKRTEFCEFHMNAALEKHRHARQDLNTGSGLGFRDKSHDIFKDKKNREISKYMSKYDKYYDSRDKTNATGVAFDRFTQTQYYVNATPASLIDGEHQRASDRERSEALRRRLAGEEKERDIMRQLGKAGRGAGREYMKVSERGQLGSSVSTAGGSSSTAVDSSAGGQRPPADARSLGLVGGRGDAKIHLSPVKRKRTLSTLSSSGSTASAKAKDGGFGWGATLKDKLARMKEGQRVDGSTGASSSSGRPGSSQPTAKSSDPAGYPPARKKTRFVTEKGIREAGRDSLAGDLRRERRAFTFDDDDDDDELVILP